MRRSASIALLLALLPIAAHSQITNREITVRIVDTETKTPIRDVRVSIPGSAMETTTNTLGYFQMEVDTAHFLGLEANGYLTSRIKILPDIDNFQIELIRQKETQDSSKTYLDEYAFDAEQSDARYYRVIKNNPAEPGKLLCIDYHLDGKPKEKWSFVQGDLYIRDGLYNSYYPNGKKREEGLLKSNTRIGKWTSWYANGQIKEESFYDKYKDPRSRYAMENYWDSLGNQLVSHGHGEQVVADEIVSYAKGPIKNGVRSGNWTGFFENGKIAFEEEYENGRMLKGRSFDNEGKEYKYEGDENISLNKFYEFVSRDVRYPADARRQNIQGKALIHMLVDQNHDIIKTAVVQGIGGGCDEEAIRIVRRFSGKWNWGKKRGQPYKPAKPQSYFLPIVFKLG